MGVERGNIEDIAVEGILRNLLQDAEESIWFSSWPWNSGPALYSLQGARGRMGVCLTSPHVFCGPGEGLQLRTPRDPVGGT